MYFYEFYVDTILDLSYISYYIMESGSLLNTKGLRNIYWLKETSTLTVCFEYELDSLEYQELYNIIENAKTKATIQLIDIENVDL